MKGEEYSVRKIFPLGDYKIKIGLDKYNYILMHKEFLQYADRQRAKFIRHFDIELTNMEQISKYGMEVGLALIDEVIGETVDKLIQQGIYDLDKNEFINRYYIEKYCDWNKYYDKVNEKYLDIILTEQQKDLYRQEKSQSRGRWEGGGFGLGGALKGAATAGALNLAGDMMHGAFDAVDKGLSTLEAIAKKTNCIRIETPSILGITVIRN